MEYMLYPTGSGFNTYCPSYANGYQANVNLYNTPYMYGYGYNNPFGNYTAQADATRVSNNTEMYNQLLSNGIDPKNIAYEPSAADRIAQASQQAEGHTGIVRPGARRLIVGAVAAHSQDRILGKFFPRLEFHGDSQGITYGTACYHGSDGIEVCHVNHSLKKLYHRRQQVPKLVAKHIFFMLQ
jgi:hypothetical protein